MLVERMKSRGLGSLLCLVAALVALVTAVVFFATQAEAAPLGHTGIMPGLLSGISPCSHISNPPIPYNIFPSGAHHLPCTPQPDFLLHHQTAH